MPGDVDVGDEDDSLPRDSVARDEDCVGSEGSPGIEIRDDEAEKM